MQFFFSSGFTFTFPYLLRRLGFTENLPALPMFGWYMVFGGYSFNLTSTNVSHVLFRFAKSGNSVFLSLFHEPARLREVFPFGQV